MRDTQTKVIRQGKLAVASDAFLNFLRWSESNDIIVKAFLERTSTAEDEKKIWIDSVDKMKEVGKKLEEEYESRLEQEWYLLLYRMFPLYYKCTNYFPAICFKPQYDFLNEITATYSLDTKDAVTKQETKPSVLLLGDNEMSISSLVSLLVIYSMLLVMVMMTMNGQAHGNEITARNWTHSLNTILWWHVILHMFILIADVCLYHWVVRSLFSVSFPQFNVAMLSLDKQLTRVFKIFSTLYRQQQPFSSTAYPFKHPSIQIKANALIIPLSQQLCDNDHDNGDSISFPNMQFVQGQQDFIANRVLHTLIAKMQLLNQQIQCHGYFSSSSLPSSSSSLSSSSAFVEQCKLTDLWQIYRKYKITCQIFFQLVYHKFQFSHLFSFNSIPSNRIFSKLINNLPLFGYCYYYYCYQLNAKVQEVSALLCDRNIIVKTQMKWTKLEHSFNTVDTLQSSTKPKPSDSAPCLGTCNNLSAGVNRLKWTFEKWNGAQDTVYDHLYRLQRKTDQLNAQICAIYSQYKACQSFKKIESDAMTPIFCDAFMDFSKVLHQMESEYQSLLKLLPSPPQLQSNAANANEDKFLEWPEEEIDMSSLVNPSETLMEHSSDFALAQNKAQNTKKNEEKWINGEQLFEYDMKHPIDDQQQHISSNTYDEDENEKEEWVEPSHLPTGVKNSLVKNLTDALKERKQLRQSIPTSNDHDSSSDHVLQSESTHASATVQARPVHHETKPESFSMSKKVSMQFLLSKSVLSHANNKDQADVIGQDDGQSSPSATTLDADISTLQ
ncbi:hypothetical protein RFI_09485 [Reticulomyxa filosa]|uniref:Uncharacterized protein n=1 Tax=Reticulomyxa filosa TaxID=46433 RepID=X6NNQ7_RETFI|nr:hypothetical protein RFI_09485 [Reticulomyxa filosa]|eukprot:ETO27646.1 hypothetical protein RFI_09485 [Reticulomyxa filosa]